MEFSINSTCNVPQDWLFPFCEEKVKWIREYWDSHYRCYVQEHAVDPDDTCSILIYLSEVESWCPLLEYRKRMREPITDRPRKEAYLKRNDYDLMAMMKPDHWRWMRQRIRRLWPGWIKGLESLMDRNHPVQHHWPKRIFLYMGSFANNPSWFKQAFTGAPLGELVQWSDLITALFILGHNIVLCTRREEVKNHLNIPKSKTCASKSRIDEYDLIFTDYVGITFFKHELGPNFSQYRCRLRILDSFGTEAEFNYKDSSKPALTKKRSTWGGENLHLRQFMTMFPHTPDNTFLGFVVEVAMDKVNPVKTEPGKKPIGLVYGKDARFWMFKEKYLEVLSKYLDLHGTVAGARVRTFVPSYVTNHRIMNGRDYQELLSKTKIYIGLGFPYDGPAPLEAIAHGSVFLNAKLDPPHSRENTAFFKEKPTSRKLTSQHPYAEKFIGKPYVYTIDINSTQEVEKTVQEILNSKVRPYIPYEWTPAGMLERVNALVNNQNFCDQSKKWLPVEELHVYVSKQGKSCSETCEEHGLLCESSFFNDINNLEAFKRHGIECLSSSTKDSLHAPSSSSVDKSCLLQKTSLIYSCSGSSPIYSRLCPCRDFKPQQVALCKKCT
ncbi:alpha-1,6-mannosylglycoprotein 6-beta-N-acetylglucosaminyltransferase A-like isoform X2 [Actinia tenebrosa]|uniref:alpha-1,6-mannosyl-glycoprotein 6-beta-N-acetylglucosaminyltransferase n=1 Tax=Actinia tenebrosa TaxID=6105 RepID=A0A6P8JEK9_ACTTE|nr:alpha-1,6-mannosylglycoprotein 6-beta-N-acetylglucosaminyltransferase A-like isoform X2 [Actinia tenebrosa]